MSANVALIDQVANQGSTQIESHLSSATESRGRIYQSIIETIGATPLVQLNKVKKAFGLSADIMAKIEYFNPAGSVKDRAAMAMISELMASPSFSEQTEIIEATSGNNGVSCAWICAMMNIPLTIVIPEHMSIERRKLIKHYGAKVITTPKALGTKGAIDKAKALIATNSNAVMLDQFANGANTCAHAETTAEEIWRDTAGQVDVIVAGVGTGGTITGIAKRLKAFNPRLKVIAVEPSSCPVLSKGRSGVHKIQGLSSGHVPDILDVELLDQVIAVDNQDAIDSAKILAKIEGLPVGISAGAALFASVEVAKQMPSAKIVTIFADTAERYFSTELFE